MAMREYTPGASVRELRLKAGFPHIRLFDDSRRFPPFTPIIAALRQTELSVKNALNERELSRLCGRLIHFMEANFGRESDPESQLIITKFPFRLFSDFREKGAMYYILHTCFHFADEHGWPSLDFKDEARKELLLQMAVRIDKVLKRENLLPAFKVFFAPSLPAEQVDDLRDKVHSKGAVVVSTSEVASHIVYPDLEGTRETETEGQVLVRLIKKENRPNGMRAYVHWWYHPDSYDDWVPARDVVGRLEEPRESRSGPWHVQARWIRDSELFNEWMNEQDYEIPLTSSHLLGGSSPVSKLGDVTSSPATDGINAEKPDSGNDKTPNSAGPSNEETSPDHDIDEDVVSSEQPLANGLNGHSSNSGSAEDLANEEKTSLAENANASSIGSTVKPAKSAALTKEPEVIKFNVPTFSSWFDVSKIHEMERNACPEFFSGKFKSKTPEVYMEVRNYFVNTWRKTPHRYVTVSSSRGKLVGDICAILRVHKFLEHWGLINHEVSQETLPLPILSSPPPAVPAFENLREMQRGYRKVPLLFDDGSVALVSQSRVVASTMNGSPQKRPRHSRRRLVVNGDDGDAESEDDEDLPQRSSVEYHCDVCGADCSTIRFHCATRADMDLCESCFKSRKYPQNMQPRDFIQMKSAGCGPGSKEVDDRIWTESETLLLLEALEMYGDNWELVAEHVGSKDKDQCVMQFVRLPIEDRFLDNPEGQWSKPKPKKSDMTPIEMLKKAGAKGAALSRISTKTNLPLPFSGKPIIFGADDQTDVTACALHLSTLTNQKLIAKSKEKISRESKQKLIGNISDLEPWQGRDFIETGESDLINNEANIKMTSQDIYVKRRDELPSARDLTEGDAGRLATEVIMQDLSQVVDSSNKAEANLEEHRSASAAAAVALSAAAARADQLQRLERAELDRLITMAVELKLEQIRCKLDQFEALNVMEEQAGVLMDQEAHERFAREMRAQHRLGIRDVNAIPLMQGPIGVVSAEEGISTVPRDVAQILHPRKSSKKLLTSDTAFRTYTKPGSAAAYNNARYAAAQQLVLQQVQQAAAQHHVAQQNLQPVNAAPYVNGIAMPRHSTAQHVPNGSTKGVPSDYVYAKPNGIHTNQRQEPFPNVERTPRTTNAATVSVEASEKPVIKSQEVPEPSNELPAEAQAGAKVLSMQKNTGSSRTATPPVVPAKSIRPRSRKRARSSNGRSTSRPKSRRSAGDASGSGGDDIAPLQSSSRKPRSTRSENKVEVKPKDTPLKLRVRIGANPSEGRVRKRSSSRGTLSPSVKLRLPLRPPVSVLLRLRIRPSGKRAKKNRSEGVELDSTNSAQRRKMDLDEEVLEGGNADRDEIMGDSSIEDSADNSGAKKENRAKTSSGASQLTDYGDQTEDDDEEDVDDEDDEDFVMDDSGGDN